MHWVKGDHLTWLMAWTSEMNVNNSDFSSACTFIQYLITNNNRIKFQCRQWCNGCASIIAFLWETFYSLKMILIMEILFISFVHPHFIIIMIYNLNFFCRSTGRSLVQKKEFIEMSEMNKTHAKKVKEFIIIISAI